MATVNGSRKLSLSQPQRVVVAVIYLVLLVLIFSLLGGNFRSFIFDSNVDSSILFYAGAFMIILGAYVVEPFFTKPSDAIANSTATLITLFGITYKQELFGYPIILGYALLVLFSSLISIFLRETQDDKWKKLSRGCYWIAVNLGNYKTIFSLVYLSAAYSYFGKQDSFIAFNLILVFWICLVFFDVVGVMIEKAGSLFAIFNKSTANELGQAIGCDNPLLYKVEVDYSRHKRQEIKYGDIVAIETTANVGSIGMIISSRYLLNKKWLSIYLLKDSDSEVLKIDLKSKKLITEEKSIFTKENLVYHLDKSDLPKEIVKQIDENELYQNRSNFIGYVTTGSDINTINFSILRDVQTTDKKITEGDIIKAYIYGQETLYQIINGNTHEEHLENFDKHGFIVGVARKLGKYIFESKELDVSKWMPTIYSPLFFAYNEDITEAREKEIAENAIGRLPDTSLEIPIKDYSSLVTHNTAILGILGIGKSCLAYELIRKIAENGVKIVCIDITNEYHSDKGLLGYFAEDKLDYELKDEDKKELKDSKNNIVQNDPNKSGNHERYAQIINDKLSEFLEGDKQVLILNPDLHPATKGEKLGYNIYTSDLTLAEKTRVISERLFVHALNNGQSDTAKYLMVFEEAHSLIPEWNSVSYEGDKTATNGTAKVILQGRKYGLGSLVVTQRTANVSKSILNQCNTIFALRVFDDTGKGFLENYIGEDYSSTLPTLEERHAIAIGKGLKLKQPVIIELNDKKHLIISVQRDEGTESNSENSDI